MSAHVCSDLFKCRAELKSARRNKACEEEGLSHRTGGSATALLGTLIFE